MTDAFLLEALSSSDYDRIIEALFYLGSERVRAPSEALIQKVVELISGDDAEIRHRAIFTAGLHWHCPEAVPSIIAVINNSEEEDFVLECSVAALGSIGHDNQHFRELAILELAKIVSNSSIPEEVRCVAYTSAEWAASRINADEYAKRSSSRTKHEIDWDWVNSIVRLGQ